MCLSRFCQVVERSDPGWVWVEDAFRRRRRVSLLAFDGPEPQPGDWLVVHAGYALGSANGDHEEVI
jgi:hydrogenase maturation factor